MNLAHHRVPAPLLLLLVPLVLAAAPPVAAHSALVNASDFPYKSTATGHTYDLSAWLLFTNGHIATLLTLPDAPVTLCVYADGTPFDNVFPNMLVTLNDRETLIDTFVSSFAYSRFCADVPTASPSVSNLSIAFTNDMHSPVEDRNLVIRSIELVYTCSWTRTAPTPPAAAETRGAAPLYLAGPVSGAFYYVDRRARADDVVLYRWDPAKGTPPAQVSVPGDLAVALDPNETAWGGEVLAVDPTETTFIVAMYGTDDGFANNTARLFRINGDVTLLAKYEGHLFSLIGTAVDAANDTFVAYQVTGAQFDSNNTVTVQCFSGTQVKTVAVFQEVSMYAKAIAARSVGSGALLVLQVRRFYGSQSWEYHLVPKVIEIQCEEQSPQTRIGSDSIDCEPNGGLAVTESHVFISVECPGRGLRVYASYILHDFDTWERIGTEDYLSLPPGYNKHWTNGGIEARGSSVFYSYAYEESGKGISNPRAEPYLLRFDLSDVACKTWRSAGVIDPTNSLNFTGSIRKPQWSMSTMSVTVQLTSKTDLLPGELYVSGQCS